MFSISRLLKRSPGKFRFCVIKHVSGKPRVLLIPGFDDELLKGLENGTMSGKNHPGKLPREQVEFDDKMVETIEIVLKDTKVKNLIVDAQKFCRYLKGREPPITKSNYAEKKTECTYEVLRKMKFDPSNLPDQVDPRTEKVFSKQVKSLLKTKIYNWQPINYTTYVGKQYLVGRMIAEYAALSKIFSEIVLRCPDFHPTSLFDFGSGVGTVTMAARKYWSDSITECYNIDSSPDMHSIAELMLKGGVENAELPISRVYYRQFLPSRTERQYDLVVSSYTLLDLPSSEIRLKTLLNLWNKTKDFLILAEFGTSSGFQLIHEARDFLLHIDKTNEHSPGIHIFSPCPHETACPMKKISDKACRFKANYLIPPIGRRRGDGRELFSFLILRKGNRQENDKQWPRVLKAATKRNKITRCRVCCADGKMRFLSFSKKRHGREMNFLLRRSKSGDRLPLVLDEASLDFYSDDETTRGIELTEADNLSDGESEDEADYESDS